MGLGFSGLGFRGLRSRVLGPYYNTAPNILATQKGTIILATTHMALGIV